MTTAKSPTLSDAEEAEIKAGIARDPENPEWTDAEFASSRPFAEVFPKLAEAIRERGLRKPPTKKTVSLRWIRMSSTRSKLRAWAGSRESTKP